MADHKEQDRQSLMLHTEAIKMMQADSALIERALSTLDRWEGMEFKPHPSLVEWRRILLEHDWSTALSTSDHGYQIRQSSPVGCILSNEKRLDIIWECRGSTSSLTKEEWKQQMAEGMSRYEAAEKLRNKPT